MQEYIDSWSLLSEARIMQKDCNVTYILIEGKSDEKFFKTLINYPKNVCFRVVNGWERVYKTILLSQNERYANILGIIDKDYHLLIKDEVAESEQLVFTDSNDIEMMLFFSSALEKFFLISADETKLKSQGDPREIILRAASNLGALRLLSLANSYNFCFEGLECKDFIDKNTLSPNSAELIRKVMQRTRSKGISIDVTQEEVKKKYDECIRLYSASNLCNGHDVLEILGISMMKKYASYSSTTYTSDNLFDYLLMGYSIEEFQRSNLYKKVNKWIIENVEVV